MLQTKKVHRKIINSGSATCRKTCTDKEVWTVKVLSSSRRIVCPARCSWEKDTMLAGASA